MSNKSNKTVKQALESLEWDLARELINAASPGSLKGQETLLSAVIKGSPPDLIDLLVGKGVSVNEVNRFNDSAITLAVWHNQPASLIEKLLQLGADPNNSNTNGNCPLTLSAEAKAKVDVVRLLLKAGAKVNQENNYRDTSLTLGVWNKAPLALMELYVRAGADVNHSNANGSTPLILAGEINASPKVVCFLLSSGADPNRTNKWGDTGLTLCAWKNSSPRLAQALINGGADVNARNCNGNSVVSLAAEANASEELVAVFLSHGAKVNAVNNWGDSALTLAAWKNVGVPVVVELLKAGANVNQKNQNGNYPLSLAQEAHADPKLIALLQQATDGTLDLSLYDTTALTALFSKTRIREGDRANYIKVFLAENFLDAESFSTLDRGTLKDMGVKLADANQILHAIFGPSGAGQEAEQHPAEEESLAHPGPRRSLSVLPELPGGVQWYFFASHSWGEGEDANHHRVGLIVDEFMKQGKPVRYHAERLSGNIESQITNSVDQSAFFVVFVTRTYMNKVIEGAESDTTEWCQYEFAYAGARKPRRMIAVAMEKAMLNIGNWEGPVCARLGDKVYLDFTSDDKLESCVDALGKWIASAM